MKTNINNLDRICNPSYKSILLIIIVSCLLSIGCSKEWLDEKPDQSMVLPSTLIDFQLMMDYSDRLNRQGPSLHEIASDGHYATNPQTLNGEQKNAYSWSYEFPAGGVDWNNAYSAILSCNIVLDGIKKGMIDESTNKEWNNIKGQALMFRALKFFDIAQIYAPALSQITAEAKLGIPIRLEADVNIPSKRSTVKETYDQIIKDLKEASSILPIKSLYKTRPSKPAALAMLARVYLALEDYDAALIYSDSCLKIQSALIDFNTLNTTLAFPITNLNEEIIFHNELINYTTLGARLLIDKDLFDSFHVNDIRRSAYFKSVSAGIGFKGNYTGQVIPFSGLATDEQYLIRAECLARKGKVSEAMLDLNKLLQSRWKKNPNGTSTYTDQTASTADEALLKVLNERKKELILRGLRWSDLRRLNKDSRFAITIQRVVGTVTYVLEPNSFKYTFPLPESVREKTAMEQNPGWDK